MLPSWQDTIKATMSSQESMNSRCACLHTALFTCSTMSDTCIVAEQTRQPWVPQTAQSWVHRQEQTASVQLREGSPAAGEMVQMMAVLEFPTRLVCTILVSLRSLKGTWLLPCSSAKRGQRVPCDFNRPGVECECD